MRYVVRLYPDTINSHLSQIYAGLNQLHRANVIRLKHLLPDYKKQRLITSHTLWMAVTNLGSGMDKNLCYDLGDASAIASADGLKKCDAYFKRSFEKEVVERLSPELACKVKPYGLNVPYISEHTTILLKQLVLYYLCPSNIGTYANRTSRFDVFPFMFHFLNSVFPYLPSVMSDLITNYSSDVLQERLLYPPKKRVVFQTRLRNPQTLPDPRLDIQRLTVEINENRVDLIRTLRRELGQRFVGGLIPDEYTERFFKDCITNLPTRRDSYMRAVKESLVAIASKGLHNSNPWSLAEYLAAGKCIVAERLIHELPNPLIEGKNVFFFSSSHECVSSCYKLLEDEQIAFHMQQNNLDYYQEFVRPSSLIGNTFKAAFQN